MGKFGIGVDRVHPWNAIIQRLMHIIVSQITRTALIYVENIM